MTTYKFPSDISDPKKELPFMKISLVRYYHQNLIVDSAKLSSNIRQGSSTAPVPLSGVSGPVNTAVAAVINTPSYVANIPNGVFGKQKKKSLGIDIILPIPTGLQSSWSPNWEMADTRLISTLTSAEGIQDGLQNIGSYIASNFLDRLQQITAARVPNPRKQALFNAIDPRTFSFDWTFTPQSEREAVTVQNIVKTLTTYSLPKKVANESQFEFPAEFEITFHNIEGAPKLSTCVCTGISSSMGPNSLQLLNSNHTVQTTLSLSFLETELKTQDNPGI